MELDSDYWNALDKAKELRVDPGQIGIAHGIGDVGEGLKANVFRGAKVVELGFMGMGKGFRSQPGGHTPETYGTREREEMRELAKVNEMEVTVHASPNIGYAAGFSAETGSFRPEMRENVLHEVERAIDFAADVSRGGPVVMHLGEFPRPVFNLDQDEQGKPRFQLFPKEAERAPLYMVDERTGQISELRRDATLPVPIPEKKGVDRWEHPKRDDYGVIEFETKNIAELEKEAADRGIKNIGAYIFGKYIKRELDLEEGETRRYRTAAKEVDEKYQDMKTIRENFEKEREEDPDTARRHAIRFMEGRFREEIPRMGSSEHDRFLEDPFSFIHKREEEIHTQAEGLKQIAGSHAAQVAQQKERIGKMKPIEEYGVKQTAETIARAAMNAYEQEKAKKLKEPLWIAPENWRPEEYGSHPAEYKKIITDSRDAMARMLVEKQGMDREEAEKVAKEHVRGTFDIGHANFWYKYFEGSKKDFDKWVEKEVDKLTKDGIIGHVHLSDNFGYHDEHLSPGEGNAPIQRFVQQLKDKGYAGKFIGEPGGQKEGRYHQALTESWRILGSPMYRIDTTSQSWTDIESSYFGRAPQPPNFVVGDYAPSKDWTLWSEVPLE